MSEHRTAQDVDPAETREWLESIDSVLRVHGPERAHFLLDRLIDHTRRSGGYLPYSPNTAYLNTISAGQQDPYPGDLAVEKRILAYIRWNAMATVVQANRSSAGIGGHIATYASSAVLYEVGFNHFWQFPTVSMGLGPMMAIYQARFTRYLEDRGLVPPSDRKIWCFLGDGEMDEPESLGAITLPVRERLDNLVFVINCNLQRLDGPVRGNGKIIQELEASFGGAGWNVIKVLWGSRWDPLLAQDTHGLLRRRMEECVDGEYQAFKANDGDFVRRHFFGKYPELEAMVANMSDEDIWRLNRGGQDQHKVYAAYAAAMRMQGAPTVILAKTVKGFGMGAAGEGQNITHQQKKLDESALKAFRDRFDIPVTDAQIDEIDQLPFCRPEEDSREARYIRQRRKVLGGALPARRIQGPRLELPSSDPFEAQYGGSGEREISTTMVLVRMLTQLMRDKHVGQHILPIVPDEARTFGMEGMFRQFGIYSSVGQLYRPQDADQLMYYREDKKGQILEEGINEGGSMCSWIAAATAYANHGIQIVPFYLFYSMFGFQRVGDFIWAGGDMQSRGFLIGATAGRTTLAGEGLQHQDGHSQLLASTVPNCVSYDPCYGYELAVIVRDGLRRMIEAQENVFYYITCMNENYIHPAMPERADVENDIVKGMYLMRRGPGGEQRVQLLGSGTILREVLAAADLLGEFGVAADVWSVTSFSELRREGLAVARHNRLHPELPPERCHVEEQLADRRGPFIAATDYMMSVADQIREWVPGRYVTLGTDGFGRSDSRESLRQFFEVDRRYVAVAALKALVDEGRLQPWLVSRAIKRFEIDPELPPPWTV